jgi:hypothetical protein
MKQGTKYESAIQLGRKQRSLEVPKIEEPKERDEPLESNTI